MRRQTADVFTRTVHGASRLMVWVAAVAVVSMMLLTCADIVLRWLRRPIPGTYELVGFFGALAVAFALAHTSVVKGHIAVDFLVQRLSPRWQAVVDIVNAVVAAALFGLVAWRSTVQAAALRRVGEVSMTLQLPVYPVVYGVAAGCALLTLVLVARIWSCLRPPPASS